MSIKFSVEAAVPGVLVWLDQDQRDKTEEGPPAACLCCLRCYHLRTARPPPAYPETHHFPAFLLRNARLSPPGMKSGVLHSSFFLLYLTQCVFSRYFCKMEIRTVSPFIVVI